MNAGAHVLGYARVSRPEEALNGHSLDAQETAIRAECDRRGWVLVDVVRDEGVSGKSLERPGLTRALRRVARGEAAGLVVARYDRLSRSVVDFGLLLEWFRDAGAFVVALDFGVDTSTPQGELMAGMLMQFAQFERRLIAQRTREGLAAARAKGKRISRPTLVDENPELAERIVQMRESGLSLQRIADALNAECVPTVRGGSTWRPSSIQAVTGYKRAEPRRQRVDLPKARRRRRQA